MPAPFTSAEAGEAWVWGDYVILLESNPQSFAEGIANIASDLGKTKLAKLLEKPPIEYPFAMTAFYRMDRNPHGPSRRPVMVVALEKMDYSKIRKKMQEKGMNLKVSPSSSEQAKIFIGLFTAQKRANLGVFDGQIERNPVTQLFLDIIGPRLELAGEPTRIGTANDIYGHPETGWPTEKRSPSNHAENVELKKGLTVSVICVLVVITLFILFF